MFRVRIKYRNQKQKMLIGYWVDVLQWQMRRKWYRGIVCMLICAGYCNYDEDDDNRKHSFQN